MYAQDVRIVWCCLALLISACVSEDNTETPSTSEPRNGVQTSNETTIFAPSVGLIRIGPSAYDLTFNCVDQGANEVLAVGVGTDANGKNVHAFVQAFVGESYVGVEVGDDISSMLFEPRLEVPLEFTFQHDILRFDTVEFVTDLDVDTATYTPAGTGSVVIECNSYETELPRTNT